MRENIEINDQYLVEILDNNDILMDLAMQIISNDKTVRNETVQDLKDFNLQSLTTLAKKRRTISFYDACYQKNF